MKLQILGRCPVGSALLALILISELVQAEPSDSATEFRDHYYQIVASPGISWIEAARKAQEMGGTLVSIESQVEREFIADLGLELGKQYWIGIFERSRSRRSPEVPNDSEVWLSGRPNFFQTKYSSRWNGESTLPRAGVVQLIAESAEIAWCFHENGESIGGFIVEWEKRGPDGSWFTAELPERLESFDPLSDNAIRRTTSSATMPGSHLLFNGVAVLPSIASAISESPPTEIASRTASVQALLVADLGDQKLVGMASKLNLTALPTENNAEPASLRFNQEVGEQMDAALSEVVRFIRIRHGGWPRAHQIEVAFANKHTPKDGPSAAVACALLLDSALSGDPLRPSFAVTGDLNADGTVQPIGGVAAKVIAAETDGCELIAIPSENVEELIDEVILGGPGIVAAIPAFSVKTFEEARAVAISTGDDTGIGQSLTEFREITALYRRDAGKFAQMVPHPAVRDKLRSIHERTPNLVSADILLRMANGTLPANLSLRGSIDWIEELTSDLLRGARESSASGKANFSGDGLADAISSLTKMRQTIDPRCIQYSDALVDFGRLIRVYIQSPPAPGNSTRRAIEAIDAAIARVDSARERILKDAGMMKEVIK